MKFWLKILVGMMGVVAGSILLLGLLLIALFLDINVGFVRGVEYDYLSYNETEYSRQWPDFHFTRGRRLGGIEWDEHSDKITFQIRDGGIYAIRGDADHDFLWVNTGFRGDRGSYVRDGVEIPVSGTVTEVYNNYNQSTKKPADIAMFERIASLTGEMTEFTTDNLAGNQRKFYFAYDNCPVAAHTPGSIVYADGNLLFVKEGDSSYDQEDWWSGSGKGIVITEPNMLEFIKANSWALLPGSYEE